MLDTAVEEISANLAGIIFSDDPSTEQLYYANNSAGTGEEYSGELKLWRQLLIEGLTDYQKFINSFLHKKKFDSAFDWFFNEPDPNWLGSFTTVCYTLNLEPSYVRRMLVNWTKRNYKPQKLAQLTPKGPPLQFYVSLSYILRKGFKRFRDLKGTYE